MTDKVPEDPRREVMRNMLTKRYHGAIEVTEEMVDAVLAGLDEEGLTKRPTTL